MACKQFWSVANLCNFNLIQLIFAGKLNSLEKIHTKLILHRIILSLAIFFAAHKIYLSEERINFPEKIRRRVKMRKGRKCISSLPNDFMPLPQLTTFQNKKIHFFSSFSHFSDLTKEISNYSSASLCPPHSSWHVHIIFHLNFIITSAAQPFNTMLSQETECEPGFFHRKRLTSITIFPSLSRNEDEIMEQGENESERGQRRRFWRRRRKLQFILIFTPSSSGRGETEL